MFHKTAILTCHLCYAIHRQVQEKKQESAERTDGILYFLLRAVRDQSFQEQIDDELGAKMGWF